MLRSRAVIRTEEVQGHVGHAADDPAVRDASAGGDPPLGKDVQALGRILVRQRVAATPLDDDERVPRELLLQVELVVQRSPQRRDAVTEELGQVDLALAEVRRDREHTPGSQNAPKLREHDRKLVSRQVLERVERDGSRARTRTERNLPHVGAHTTHSSIPATKREHPRREIESDHGETSIREVAADLARTGAHVDGGAATDPGGGRVEDGSIDR
jgi:hypothetical protein